ncbi:hypothetical protein ElyMa_002553400 [Elysia marginata]|uniref:EF-hand domain-containing protein n=1 Tax=Elysia marginata TaxID=1093978 RepID=A0AAV4GY23_9GAST|nr:hypothetical protein ElyMa_002553400 [Elysia marginata]
MIFSNLTQSLCTFIFQILEPASRTDWVWRNSQRYGGKYPDVSSLAFDFYDRDGDLKLTSRDLQMLAENLDYNGKPESFSYNLNLQTFNIQKKR